MSKVSGLVRAAAGVGVAGVAGLAYANAETRRFVVRDFTVPVLPPGEKDVRVLCVSDFHLVPSQQRKLEWISSLRDLKPDLVVNTGDNLAHADAVDPLLEALGPLLTETPGVFVNGSNDYWAPVPKNPARYLLPDSRGGVTTPDTELPWRTMVETFTESGWKNLNNRRDSVTLRDGRALSFVGVDDAHSDLDVFPRRDDATADGPTTNGGAGAGTGGATTDGGNGAGDGILHVGVTHAPYLRVLSEFQEDGAALVLVGHTHGGQLRIPGFGALVTNCDLDRRRASGLNGWPGARPDSRLGTDSLWLHVSAGAGTSPYAPFRFACRPEASLLTLVPADTTT
ncbi:MAG: metallophosphoesterase [Cellulomonadaceae bacterium]|jgi:predicted MPP superfamily phosphohydrolase|nr:metallophosphoesterase [Cellulomonadaceae bacterium]